MTCKKLTILGLITLLVAGCGGGGDAGAGVGDGPASPPVVDATDQQDLMDFSADRVAGPLPLIVKFNVTPARGVEIASYQ